MSFSFNSFYFSLEIIPTKEEENVTSDTSTQGEGHYRCFPFGFEMCFNFFYRNKLGPVLKI